MAKDERSAAPALRIARRSVLGGLAWSALLGAAPAWAHPLPERRLHLVCPETGEEFKDAYWCRGSYLPALMQRIDWLMRDFHCNASERMDPALIDLLQRIYLAAGGRRPIQILSGYRTLATNRALRREGMPAVTHSQHLAARAADISIEGMSIARLGRAAALQRCVRRRHLSRLRPCRYRAGAAVALRPARRLNHQGLRG